MDTCLARQHQGWGRMYGALASGHSGKSMDRCLTPSGSGEEMWDVASRPRWNVHGHVSQSSVMLGVLSGKLSPICPGPVGPT